MAKSKEYNIEGKSMYARVFEFNRDMEGYEGQYEPFDGMYTIMVGVPVDSDDYKTIMSWNKNYEPKIGGSDRFPLDREGVVEGLAYFTFKRKHKFVVMNQKSEKFGEIIEDWGGAPRVRLLRDNGTIVPFPEDTLIGNGSDVTVKLSVAPVGRVNVVRLEAVLVNNLVPYGDDQAPKSDPEGKGEPDDDIPF